ncbi:MAG TPA: C-GCAxxG-C-C family protein [Clostridia bacterium]|nr:C-GCAxxG-C-C family protein [Clostridia bacterium]
MLKKFTELPDAEKKDLIDKAASLGYEYERKYGNCPQCTIAAIQDTFGIIDDDVFKQSYGFGAGIGLTSKGTCGALSAAILIIGSLHGREKADFHSGRNAKCYELSKQLVEKVEEEYGGILCHEIQRKIMGDSFDLNKQEEFLAFEAAGGHDDKCPSVIAFVAGYLAELIVEGEL